MKITKKELEDIQGFWECHIDNIARLSICNIVGGKVRVEKNFHYHGLNRFDRDKVLSYMSKSGARLKIKKYIEKGYLRVVSKGYCSNVSDSFEVSTTRNLEEMFNEARSIVTGYIGEESAVISRNFLEDRIKGYLMRKYSPTFITKYMTANDTGILIL